MSIREKSKESSAEFLYECFVVEKTVALAAQVDFLLKSVLRFPRYEVLIPTNQIRVAYDRILQHGCFSDAAQLR